MDHSHVVSGSASALPETYSSSLIVLSIFIAILSSFTAFGTAERQYNARYKRHKVAWNIFGAISMGLGIWAMHFIGMLAFSLPVPIFYDVLITSISVIPAIFACSVVLSMMAQQRTRAKDIAVGGLLLGLGIGLMHYIGMAAMRMDAVMVHNMLLFYSSLVMAVILATIALKVKQQAHASSSDHFLTKKHIMSAVVMGLATSSMHYIAMASVDFYPSKMSHTLAGLNPSTLTTVVSIVVVLILVVAIAVPYFLRYKQLTGDLNASLKRLNLAMGTAKQVYFDFNPQTEEIVAKAGDPQVLIEDTISYTLSDWKKAIHPSDFESVMAFMQKLLQQDEPSAHEYRRKIKGRDWDWVHTVGQVVERDKNNNPLRVTGITTDITERKQSELVLRILAESNAIGDESIFQVMVQTLADSQNVRYAIIASINPSIEQQADVIAVWADNHYGDNFSYSLIGSPCHNVAGQSACLYTDNVQSLFPNNQMLVDMEAVSYLGVPLKGTDNQTIGLLAIINDKPMTEKSYTITLLESMAVRAAFELERIASQKKLDLTSRVFTDTHDGVLITDDKNIILDVNPAFCTITGYSHDEVVGQTPTILSSGKHDDEFYCEMWQDVNENGLWAGEVWNRKKNGRLYIGALTISTLKNNQDDTINYLGIFSDITERKQRQNELEQMAHYDVLTKLPNRALFADRFSQAVAHSNRNDSSLAICFLDLDKFKPINDNYGHEVGDALLIEVADRIRHHIRQEDTVSRQGGDEFALLLGNLDSVEQCEYMLARLGAALAEPYIIDGYPHHISASIGVTLYPNDNEELDRLMRHADQAMYQAKLNGRNRYHLFNVQDEQKITKRQTDLREIDVALTNNEFCLYYQPKINMATGEVFGVEALIRWLHPEKELLAPIEFLPIIEGTELEITLGDWVMGEALKQLDEWRQQGIILEVSINIASHHLRSELFLAHLDSTLNLYPEVDSRYLQLEILESSALGDLAVISNIIKICYGVLGIQVALDDFGTGYSSLAHLRSLPAGIIKIDRGFVRDMLEDPNDCAIIDGVIGLAESFDRKIIAEGVETLQQGLMLMLMGCDTAQGFYIARPMPANDVSSWLNAYQPNQHWISYGKNTYSIKEKKLQLFELITKQWFLHFEKNIQSSPERVDYWPIMQNTKCPCGLWIKRERKNGFFEQNWLDDLNEKHEDVHDVAIKLKELYLSGELNDARRGLQELRLVFDRMNKMAGHLSVASIRAVLGSA